MDSVTIQPFTPSGSITIPASKSAMQRCCAAALISKGTTTLLNPGISNDDKAALSIIEALGATVTHNNNNTITIYSNGINPKQHTINCGESGLSIRMFTPIAALANTTITIEGHGSLTKRPLHFFNEVLPQVQVHIETNNGFTPLKVTGPLQPKSIILDGSLSSQYITGMLMAYAAVNVPINLRVANVTSKPYLDITLATLAEFGYKVTHHNYETFTIHQVNQINNAMRTVRVESDWSSASFHVVLAAIAGNLVIRGLDPVSPQADKAIIKVIEKAGVQYTLQNNEYHIQQSPMQPFEFNATQCPDLFPPVVALAAYIKGTSVIHGANRLTHKESNRALTLQEEFGKMGVQIELDGDIMKVHGTGIINAAEVSSHNDHRIAMACGVAASKANGAITIHGAESVAKSYPQFWTHIEMLQKNN
jgi:3-phosphoshikimate 1-carboxyvinyltransferase